MSGSKKLLKDFMEIDVDALSKLIDQVFPPKEEKMTIDSQTFKRKDFFVEALRITPENMEQAAEWCKGAVENNSSAEKPEYYIDVPVRHALNERQKKAFPGDWLLKAGTGFKVYKDKAFRNNFDAPEIKKDPIAVFNVAPPVSFDRYPFHPGLGYS